MKYLLCLSMLFVVGCTSHGEMGRRGVQGLPGDSIVGPPGQDGRDGEDGTPGNDAVIEVVDPCGKETDWDEVLFRMSDGRLFAFFETNGKRYLTIVKPGTYQTTDGTSCVFSVSETNQVEW